MRRLDPERMLAAVNEQRRALGQPLLAGPVSAATAGEASLAAVAAASRAGAEPALAVQRAAVGYTLGLLAQRAPGSSVEVRIPPFAAVQCVGGPRHVRGTPPNVVETDPLTWLELATGRLVFQAAVATGRVRASGPRADISRYLPLTPATADDSRRGHGGRQSH